MHIAKIALAGYAACAFTVFGFGAFMNGGLRGNLHDKILGLGALAAAGGFAELTSRLA